VAVESAGSRLCGNRSPSGSNLHAAASSHGQCPPRHAIWYDTYQVHECVNFVLRVSRDDWIAGQQTSFLWPWRRRSPVGVAVKLAEKRMKLFLGIKLISNNLETCLIHISSILAIFYSIQVVIAL
jgi:hypothetical protein